MLAAFGLVTLVLAAIGVYGVVSYAVGQMRHEIGVRLALGARSADVMRFVLWKGMKLVAAGTALGMVLSIGAGRLLGSLMFGVSAADPVILGLATLVMLLAGLVASADPVRRALGVDPLTALRVE